MSVKSYPRNPNFYIEKLGFAWVYIIFLFLMQNIHCGYSLELSRRTVSTNYVLSKNKKNIKTFLMKFSFFTADKNFCTLHGQVYEMSSSSLSLRYVVFVPTST